MVAMVGVSSSVRQGASWDFVRKFPAARSNVDRHKRRICIMAIKTAWQRRQEAAGKREYDRWDWICGYDSRRVQVRKALYLEGYKVNYPFRKK